MKHFSAAQVEKLMVGTALLKHGRRGKPHSRFFRLFPDQLALTWYSPGKPSNRTTGVL